VARIIAMFPPEEQAITRVRLADTLHAVISQRLLPKADGHGRVAALEVMVVTSAIRDLIVDADRTAEIREFIAEGREQYGMQTFDQHLMDLVTAGEVDFQTAMVNASNPSDFELQMRTLRRRSQMAGVPPAAAAAPPPAPAAPADDRPLGFTDDLSGMMQP
jgi:twitching motility protein PilT